MLKGSENKKSARGVEFLSTLVLFSPLIINWKESTRFTEMAHHH